MRARLLFQLIAVIAVSFSGCATRTGDGGACFRSSECDSNSVCTETVYGNFCMKQCDRETVRCDDEEACLRSSDIGFGGAGGAGGFGGGSGAGGVGGMGGAAGVGGASEEEIWVCLPGAGQIQNSEIIPRVTGQICDYSIECILAHVCVCVPGTTCTAQNRNGLTCQWLCDPTEINQCPSIAGAQPACTDLGDGRGFCDPSTIQGN